MSQNKNLKFLFTKNKGDPEINREFLTQYRVDMSRMFAKKYMNMMMFLFSFIILKRILTDD